MRKKKFLNLIIACAIPLAVQAGDWHLDKKTEDDNDIWIINTRPDLVWLSDVNSLDANDDGTDDFGNITEKWGASYRLGSNISFDADYSEVDWNNDGIVNEEDRIGFSPIGSSSEPFTGYFDGSYDTIGNIWIERKGQTNIGLFGVIKGACIHELGIANIRISSDSSNVGGLVGQVVNKGNADTNNEIYNCFVTGEIANHAKGESNTGGLVGLAQGVHIKECYVVVQVQGAYSTNILGGLIGSLTGGRIENCHVNAWVSGNANLGVLAGYVDQSKGDVQIQNCFSIGSAIGKGTSSAGGFIGSFHAGETIDCHWNPESSKNLSAVGKILPGVVADITATSSKDFAESSSFPNWDFDHTWEIGELSSKILILDIDFEPDTVSAIPNDSLGDFDPWNEERWAEWYNDKGEIIKPFVLDLDTKFNSSKKIWSPKISPEYSHGSLFDIVVQGIIIDGNGIIIDIRTDDQKLSLEQLYSMARDPWENGTSLQAFHYVLPKIEDRKPTVFKNFTIMGFSRGLKIDNLNKVHPLVVRDCRFIRNGIGFYTNGNGSTLVNCEIMESGNGGIYSGSKSHDNKFIGNKFRDNTLSQHQVSYADFIGDTYYNTVIAENHFLPSLVDVNQRLHGISTFRNQGENENLREQMPHNNIIRNNHFNGYSCAITMGSRMGRNVGYDITGEGRDYAFYNLIDSNEFVNTAVGIKINTEGNTIRNNQFSNTDNEIVLHCVFFRLKNTTIEYQDSDSVKLWYVLDDYDEYKDWFQYQDDLNGSIDKSEKRIEVHSINQSPVFPEGLDSIFVLNPANKGPEFMLEDHRFGLPFVSDTGEFSLDLPGQEIVALWDDPIARVNSTDYYSILVFDDKGTEINRCGLSEVKWDQLAVGYFIRTSGEMEIAVVPAIPIEGKYPVYIFRRGFRVPEAIWYPDNTDPSITISTDSDNKLVVTFSGK